MALLAGLALLVSFATPVAAYAPADNAPAHGKRHRDDLPNPLADKQRALKQAAIEMVLSGKVKPQANGGVVEVSKAQFVELTLEDTDLIWTVLAEFGSQTEKKKDPAGPLHNEIPEPNRAEDNNTIWRDDFNQAHYRNLLFSDEAGAVSMKNFYEELSSGRYSVDGEVEDWVGVPWNAAHYGNNDCGDIVCEDTWLFIEDSLNAWYQAQQDAGMSDAQINAYLSQYDVWDRYDHDNDGNFDEADGYIDHFQSVHAGMGEETGGGAQGTNAIWSHRWYAFQDRIGLQGPTVGGQPVLFGGTRIGNTNFWVGDYTVEPENGGLGVFAHEYAHDLGLPDLYDTSGNTGGAENSTGFWTLMSSGSYLNEGGNEIGSKPGHMGFFEKIFLGWEDYDVAFAGETSEHKLHPSVGTTAETDDAQGLAVLLPDKVVPTELTEPFAGDWAYYSETGDNVDSTMTRAFALPAQGRAKVEAKVWFDTELDWDYAYLIGSADGGETWVNLDTNLSTDSNPNGTNRGRGITGESGGWVNLTANLPIDWKGSEVLLGFEYVTDGAIHEPGFMADQVTVSGSAPLGAEAADEGWTFTGGFKRTTGEGETTDYFHAYFAEYRAYEGYDAGLETGPYNFGFVNTLPEWVERFAYQDGLLITYYDDAVLRQLGRRSSRPRPGAAGRCPSGHSESAGNDRSVAVAGPELRLDLRPPGHGCHDAAPERCPVLVPVAGRQPDVRRLGVLLERQCSGGQRDRAEHGNGDPGDE